MLERSLLLGATAILVALAVLAVRAWTSHRWKHQQRGGEDSLWASLGERSDGRAALVVFSAPGCAACRSAQQPAVDAVAERFGAALRVIAVDIARRPAAARAFGVLTAPSTAIVPADGAMGRVNHGFAAADVLSDQLTGHGVWPATPRSRMRQGRPAREEPASAAHR